MNAALIVGACVVVIGAVRVLVIALPWRRAGARSTGAATLEGAGDLGRMDRILSMSSTHAGDVHQRLRPILREIAADGLRRRGVDLDSDSETARKLLAPVTWELVRPDRPRPEDPFARGLPPKQLDAVLDDLEALMAPPSTPVPGTEPPGAGTPWA
jgi:hypothetical protein